MKKATLIYNSLTVILCCILLTLANCGSDGPQNLPVVFTLNVDSDFGTGNSDNWIIVHDVDGGLLGYQSFEDGQSITVTPDHSAGGGKVTVTLAGGLHKIESV